MNIKFELDESPSEEIINFLDKKIEEYNVARWEVKEKRPLAVTCSNENGEIVAGAAARIFGLWMTLDNLWVDDALRGQNIGTKILAKLEAVAAQRGCKFVLLDTLNFQARPFYERHGYVVQWIQQNYPRDGCKYYMVKNL